MSVEKYMERVRELLARTRSPFDETDCFSDTLWPKEIDALADAIAALCAEIETETVERCLGTLAAMAEEEQLNMLKLIAAIRAGKP